jgi:aminopeptidase N
MLRAAQFPEDAGPLAHPVRPDSYIEISNFYTATVYNKGAELIRMMHTILGPEKFRAGCDLYFSSHDGEAVTCEDFVRAMEQASGTDLTQFRLWYAQAGTPRVSARLSDDRTTLLLAQEVPPTPGQPIKQPMPIPLKLAVLDEETGEKTEERLFVFDSASAELPLAGAPARPVISLNREFSAPIVLETDRAADALAFLSARDDDPFARYEAMQQLMLDTMLAAIGGAPDHAPVIEAVRRTLTDQALDPAFVAEAVLLPSEAFVGDRMERVDPEAIHAAREALRRDLGRELEGLWRDAYAAHAANRYAYSPAAKGARRLRAIALGYIMATGAKDAAWLAMSQYDEADNMTDRQGAMGALVNTVAPERGRVLQKFYDRYKSDALVIDKWFTVQALATRDDTVDRVEALSRHGDFTLSNPNRLRSLVGAFAANQRAFHDASGRGYKFLADMILAADKLNPQTAAKLVPPLGRWRRFDEGRAARMKAELERIVGTPGLSRDVFEQASKSLA